MGGVASAWEERGERDMGRGGTEEENEASDEKWFCFLSQRAGQTARQTGQSALVRCV